MSASRSTLAYWIARDARAVSRALQLGDAGLNALSMRRLRALLAACSRAPFHAARLRAAGVSNVSTLPSSELTAALRSLAPITKHELRDAGLATLDGGRRSEAWCSSMSSGSSGEPFRVYYEARAWATLKYLVKVRSRRASGMRFADRVAILDAIDPGDEGHAPLERAGRVRRLSVFRPAEQLAAALAAFAPHAIYALPSALLEVARAMDDGAPRVRARRLFTSGELLTAAARRTIETSFGARVRDVYGTSESKEIAWECSAGSLHINADVVLVEVLGDDGSAVSAGIEGELAVTVLVNAAMPLVRYRTGDRGTLRAASCSCGLATPLLGVVTGRASDVIELPDGSTRSPYALTTALERVSGVAQYRVIQAERDLLHVIVIPGHGAPREALPGAIESALRNEMPNDVRIIVKLADRLDRGARAKVRAVEAMPRSRALAPELAAMPTGAS